MLGAPRQRLSPADLAFQESLIQERETEIREIETGIHELNEIFRDLGTLVIEQGDMLGQFISSLPFPLVCFLNMWY
jgi:t-SNARE complex subunit (syntaxin)